MKSLFLSFFAFLLLPLAASAAYTDGYYDAMNGKKRETLKKAAKECVQNHTKLVYTQLPNYWQYSDVYPDLVNGCKRWWDMYSDNVYLIRNGQAALSSFSANRMQREHAVPKSWWKKNGDVEYTPAYSDMWNLYPSDGPANQAKLNYPLGEVQSHTFDNGVTKVGTARNGQGGGSGIVFEPGNEYKGDFARAFFYMATVYDDLPWVYTYMFQQNSYPSMRDWAIDMLLDWARKDPVSQKEIERNNQVEFSQGNRNPFVDFPELAEYIWGARTTEVFYIKDQGGQVTPPITGDPVLFDPVNGEALDFNEVAVTQSVSAPLHVRGANLSNALSIRITGADKDQFTTSMSSIPAYEVCQENGYLFNVIYKPTREGHHSATLMIYDGGLPIGSDVAVKLEGWAYPIPSLSTLTAYEASDFNGSSYTASWSKAPETVDFYVLTRVTYPESGPESERFTVDTNSLVISDRDPNVTETYSVQSSRLGYLSEPSNVITVAAGASVIGIQADQPLALGAIPGGFLVMLDSTHTNLRVYDISGRLVLQEPEVSGGEIIYLPLGVYVVTTDQNRKPIKIAVR